MFLTNVIKVNKTEVLRLCFKHVQYAFVVFSVSRKITPYPLFDSLEQANFICF